MKSSLFLAACGALALIACSPAEQTTAETQTAPETPSAPTPPAIAPADFAQTAVNGDAFEVQSSQLAATRAARADIKRYAASIVTAHTATAGEIATLAPQIGLTAPAPTLSAEQSANIETLRALNGEAFDTAYLDQQIAAHESAIRLFTDYLAAAEPGPLRDWAETTLPKLQQHLTDAQALKNAT